MTDRQDQITEDALQLGAFLLVPSFDVAPAVRRVCEAAAAFFGRSLEEKAPFSARAKGTLEGWTLASATGPSTLGRPRDYEAWDAILTEGAAAPFPLADFLTATTTWPSEDLREAVTQLRDALIPVRDHAEALLTSAGGLAPDTFSKLRQGQALSSLRTLQFQTAPQRTGLYAHEDSELITLLFETEPGVHLWDPSTETWQHAIRPLETVLVLVGTAAELVSGGRLHAARHRVEVEADRPPRHSVAWFCAPGSEGILEDPRTGERQTGQEYMLRQLHG